MPIQKLSYFPFNLTCNMKSLSTSDKERR